MFVFLILNVDVLNENFKNLTYGQKRTSNKIKAIKYFLVYLPKTCG